MSFLPLCREGQKRDKRAGETVTAIDILAGYETYLRSLTDLESFEIKAALRRHPLYMDFSGQPTVQPWREKGRICPVSVSDLE